MCLSCFLKNYTKNVQVGNIVNVFVGLKMYCALLIQGRV